MLILFVSGYWVISRYLTTQKTPDGNDIKGTSLQVSHEIQLPLNIVKTSIGVSEGEGGGPLPTRITIPKTITANIPAEYVDKLEAYASAEYNKIYPIVIGPKGWVGEGTMGADGNTSLNIKPKANSKEHGYVSYFGIPACTYCYWNFASPFFPQIASEANNDPGFSSTGKVGPNPNLKIVPISPQVVLYSLPNTPDGLEVNGVASVDMIDGKLSRPFRQLEVSLPPEQHELSKIILNYFLADLSKN